MQDTPPDQNPAPDSLAMRGDVGDLLHRVVTSLHARKGTLREIARAADMSYDTVLRIKNGENDPSYGKVKRLAQVLAIDG